MVEDEGDKAKRAKECLREGNDERKEKDPEPRTARESGEAYRGKIPSFLLLLIYRSDPEVVVGTQR